jgi:hypothetical protein
MNGKFGGNMERLTSILNEAYKILHQENLGLNHVEPLFQQVLEIVHNDSNAREWFLEEMAREVVSGGQVANQELDMPMNFIDADLICFIAHATRWGEFSDACNQRKLEQGYLSKLPGSKDIADMVIDALADDWEDRDFYQAFSG